MASIAPTATKSGASTTDAALVLAARTGELWAQGALFQRHARLAFGLAYRFLPRELDADDLVQDSFLYALQHLSGLENPQAFAAWLGAIVVRTAGKRLRRERLRRRLGLGRFEPVDVERISGRTAPPDVSAELHAVSGVIARFPTDERLALILRRVECLEIPQISRRMQVSESTVKRKLRAAEARLTRSERPELR